MSDSHSISESAHSTKMYLHNTHADASLFYCHSLLFADTASIPNYNQT